MGVCYYLKPKEKNTGKSLIVLQFRYDGRKLLYSFNQKINPSNWNKKRQRVKSNQQTTEEGDYYLNDLLDNLQEVAESAYKKEVAKGIPEPLTLKKYLDDFRNQNKKDPNTPSFFKLLDRFINNEIKTKGKDKAKQTLKKYVTLKMHLSEFKRVRRYDVDFETINLDFFYKFVQFLKTHRFYEQRDRTFKATPVSIKEGLQPNTIAKDIQIIKAVMQEAIDLGYTNNMTFKNKKFSAPWEEVDAVYLNDKEIFKLYNKDFSKEKRLERVRDLFVFGCYTGLRFSDYSDVKPENIISIENEEGKEELYIKMVTKKVRESVIIPCNPIILQLFEKYKDNKNRLPKAPSNQKFNEYVKDACRKAELTETGRLVDNPDKELWQCVSSHTARRSFATNLFLQGYPNIEIMKITGHRTERAFLKYIKVSKLDAAKRLSIHIKKRWSEMILKIA
jgi:integrase